MRATVGIDPGGTATGVVLLEGGQLRAACILVREKDCGLGEYLIAVVDAVRDYAGKNPGTIVAVEDLAHPHSHIDGEVRPINVDGLTGTAVVLGAVLGHWPEAILVPPGKNGSAPLRSYPEELVGARERRGAGQLRHCRSAWDVARAAERTATLGDRRAS